ncbi:MAG: hypothetical protein K8I82_11360, partial [Anaerolineae bacterium]|nr:hypothetical protein [Anaerolineae bacterium]
VEPLIAILNDQDATVRECAIKVLNQIRDERAVEPLIAVSNDQDAKTDSIESTETITMRANSYFRSKEYIKAIQTYREALLQTPDVKTYWNNMGYIFNSFVETNFRNNIAGVSVNYNDLLAILSNSDLISSATRSLWFQLIDKVHCDGLKQCLDESERCWLRVLDINPGDFDCSIFLAHLYEDLGFREKAKVILENATPITTQERETLKSEWEYFNELGTKNLDADLRPKPYTTAASPIHKMYGDTLRSILEEIKKNRTLLHGE